ncbi:MAG: hypothetical protein Q9M41_03690 [Paracoccaceae bacterium]|nr:hypothetical protein [Paracoccaceae bacterium]
MKRIFIMFLSLLVAIAFMQPSIWADVHGGSAVAKVAGPAPENVYDFSEIVLPASADCGQSDGCVTHGDHGCANCAVLTGLDLMQNVEASGEPRLNPFRRAGDVAREKLLKPPRA